MMEVGNLEEGNRKVETVFPVGSRTFHFLEEEK
jgi:hypothetical protein